MKAAVAGRLREGRDAEPIQQHLQRGRSGPRRRSRCRAADRDRVELVRVVGVGRQVRPDVEAQAGDVDRPGDVREFAATTRSRRRPLTVMTVVVSSHSGAPWATRFWKNDGRRALRKPLHQHRPPAHRAQDRIFDAQVVLDEIELRLPALGEQQLAGTRDPNLAARRSRARVRPRTARAQPYLAMIRKSICGWDWLSRRRCVRLDCENDLARSCSSASFDVAIARSRTVPRAEPISSTRLSGVQRTTRTGGCCCAAAPATTAVRPSSATWTRRDRPRPRRRPGACAAGDSSTGSCWRKRRSGLRATLDSILIGAEDFSPS